MNTCMIAASFCKWQLPLSREQFETRQKRISVTMTLFFVCLSRGFVFGGLFFFERRNLYDTERSC